MLSQGVTGPLVTTCLEMSMVASSPSEYIISLMDTRYPNWKKTDNFPVKCSRSDALNALNVITVLDRVAVLLK